MISGIENFEAVIQVIAAAGIEQVLEQKVSTEKRFWDFHGYLLDGFGREMSRVSGMLFEENFEDIHPALKR